VGAVPSSSQACAAVSSRKTRRFPPWKLCKLWIMRAKPYRAVLDTTTARREGPGGTVLRIRPPLNQCRFEGSELTSLVNILPQSQYRICPALYSHVGKESGRETARAAPFLRRYVIAPAPTRRGSVSVNVVPAPTVLCTAICPPCAVITSCTM
jgi:hypothetical protein